MIVVAGFLMLALLVAVVSSVGADGPIWNPTVAKADRGLHPSS